MNRKLHALMLGFLVCAALAPSSYASTIENRGTPEQHISTMSSYGVDVVTRQGLKTVLPPKWQLFVHNSVDLPETMSWRVDTPWTEVLGDFAAANNISVLIDWNKHAVMLRSHEVADRESEMLSDISQDASTPLPQLSEAGRLKEAKRLEQVALVTAKQAQARDVAVAKGAVVRAKQLGEKARARSVASSTVSQDAEAPHATVATAAPTPVGTKLVFPGTPVAEAPQVVPRVMPVQVAPAPLASAPERLEQYTKPISANQPSLRSVAQGIANRFNLRLAYVGPDIQMPGPVTLLSQDPQQDVRLVEKALGYGSPFALEVSLAERTLYVLPNDEYSSRVLAEPRQVAAPQVAPEVKPAPVVAPVVVAPQAPVAVPKVVDTSSEFALVIPANAPLEDVLTKYAQAKGYTLEWKVVGGFEASRAMKFEGDSVRDVLAKVLPSLGLSADIYKQDKHIVVRPGDAARDF